MGNKNTNISANSTLTPDVEKVQNKNLQQITKKQLLDDKKKTLKNQTTRLILLRHASKCKNGAKCKIKVCPDMVKLWNHMKECYDDNCRYKHCLSSRCILNHHK